MRALDGVRVWRHHGSVLERADAFAKLTVLDEQSRAIPLETLWAERTAVLVFVRHFG